MVVGAPAPAPGAIGERGGDPPSTTAGDPRRRGGDRDEGLNGPYPCGRVGAAASRPAALAATCPSRAGGVPRFPKNRPTTGEEPGTTGASASFRQKIPVRSARAARAAPKSS